MPLAPTLQDLLAQSPRNIEAVANYFDALVQTAVNKVNTEFSPRRLVKSTRAVEPLPTDTRQLSSYRTRIGTMLEYALSTYLDTRLKDEFGPEYLLTFAVSHEYPDFYLRNRSLARLLRIEMKAVDAGSDEQAARFGVPTIHIEPEDDLLLFVGWEWTPLVEGTETIGEYPHIFTSLVVPAQAIVAERDIRLALSGGEIRGGNVFVPKKNSPGEFSPDGDNYGKLWRLVHRSRHNDLSLNPSVKRFLAFLRDVDRQSPRSRFGPVSPTGREDLFSGIS